MTEFQVSGVQDTQNKGKAKQKTQVKSGSTKDIQVFGDKKQGQGPLKPADYKMPSIFDNMPKFELDKNMPWKKAQPKIPFMSKEMRQEYDRDTIVGIYKALDNPNVSKENTQKLYETIHHLDYQNYKMAFRSFEQVGVNLVDVINRTEHLSNDQKKECLDYMVDLGKKTADYGNQRSDDVVPNMKKLVAQYDSQHGLDEVSKKRLVADFKKIINRSDTLQTAVPERPNGKIDKSYKQGQTGDCWLLAGIQSLAMTPQGKKMLDNAVKVDKNGNEKTVKKVVKVADVDGISDYARFYDDGCEGWTKDPELNLSFLRAQQQYANDKLVANGHLFLNEVYDMLGIPRTKAGQVVGWVYDLSNTEADNYVDFGLYDATKEKTRDFVNGYERTILLDFNVDGPILDTF